MRSVEELRWTGIKLITLGGWTVTAMLLLESLFLGDLALGAALASALLNIIPTYSCMKRSTGTNTRSIVAIMAALQPAFLVYAVQENGLQLDFHLYFFVSLAALTSLCDTRPIIVAGVAIVLHHSLLSWLQPSWVFAGGGSLVRVMIHGIAVFLICAILCAVTIGIQRTLNDATEARRESLAQSKLLEEQSGDLQRALHRVEMERTAREEAEAERQRQRQIDIQEFLREFEVSIATVIKSVSATARTLEETVKELDAIAVETGDQAGEFAQTAVAASKAAKRVAQGIAELSNSITNIAINVSQQDELTSLAAQRAASGSSVVSSLTEHSDTIGEATRAIVRIAERTNLLALNAAIEAATAGPAGRGFTIVAQEVKALATQAAQAATEIEEFLSGVRTGTYEAERSFQTIDEAIGELDQAARAIRVDVDGQRLSASTIQDYARNSADEVGIMADRSRAFANAASNAKTLSSELDKAAGTLIANIRELEGSTERFVNKLRAA